MTLRVALIGSIVFLLVLRFALDENSYGPRRRPKTEGENEETA